MTFSVLDRDTIEYVYNNRMFLDFPKEEIKPLKTILDGLDKGVYVCFGMFEGEELLGYAFMIKTDDGYLLDYLAVGSEHRNNGVGSEILKQLSIELKDAGSIILECEDPDLADDDAVKELRTRRIGFYNRNGYGDTGLRVECFGVPYVVLEASYDGSKPKEEYWPLYQLVYKVLLPKEMYEKNIKSRNI